MANQEMVARQKAIVRILKEYNYHDAKLTKAELRKGLHIQAGQLKNEKTIQRDIKLLQNDYQAPIKWDSQKGYILTDPQWECEFEIEDVTKQEVHALALATELAAQFKGTPLHIHLEGLTKALKARYEECNDPLPDLTQKIQFLSPPAAEIPEGVWSAVLTALLEQRWLEIRYTSATQKEELMKIAPYRLVSLENEWYLFCEKASSCLGRIRQLALRNIQAEKLLAENFTPHRDREIQRMLDNRFGWFACAKNLIPISVRFNSRIAYIINTRKWHKLEKKTTFPDGSVEVSFPISVTGSHATRYMNVKKWILGYAPYVLEITPKELKESVKKDLATAQNQLEK
jgi:predicted DNA-binding transcriptional regulator YafY